MGQHVWLISAKKSQKSISAFDFRKNSQLTKSVCKSCSCRDLDECAWPLRGPSSCANVWSFYRSTCTDDSLTFRGHSECASSERSRSAISFRSTCKCCRAAPCCDCARGECRTSCRLDSARRFRNEPDPRRVASASWGARPWHFSCGRFSSKIGIFRCYWSSGCSRGGVSVVHCWRTSCRNPPSDTRTSVRRYRRCERSVGGFGPWTSARRSSGNGRMPKRNNFLVIFINFQFSQLT